jgi:hypothetical protein
MTNLRRLWNLVSLGFIGAGGAAAVGLAAQLYGQLVIRSFAGHDTLNAISFQQQSGRSSKILKHRKISPDLILILAVSSV